MSAATVASPSQPRLLILGANGLLGRVCFHLFRSSFSLTLSDRSVGANEHNRFGLEGVGVEHAKTREWGALDIPEDEVRLIDLATEEGKLAALLEEVRPHVVIHLANILESALVDAIRLNRTINERVLRLCVEHGAKCIAASSIMLFYGAVLQSPLLGRVMRMDAEAVVAEADRLTVRSPLVLDAAAFKPYVGEGGTADQWSEYMRTKEALELLAHELCDNAAAPTAAVKPTIVPIRFGWASVRSPAEIEAADAPPASSSGASATDLIRISEASIVVKPSDLRSFLTKLVDAVLHQRITGAHVYTVVSEHAQRWVSLKDEQRDLDWQPAALE